MNMIHGVPILGIVLSPMIAAAAAMSASSLSVVTNANRLRRSRIAAPTTSTSAQVAGGDR